MAYSPKDLRAINWYAKREDLRVQLSQWPLIRFVRLDGTPVQQNIVHIRDWYNAHLKEQRRLEGRQRSAA